MDENTSAAKAAERSFMMFCRKKEEPNVLKIVLIVIGAVTAVVGAGMLLCHLFRKYFTIEFECDGDCDECSDCDAPEIEEAVEPECCEVDDESTAEA